LFELAFFEFAFNGFADTVGSGHGPHVVLAAMRFEIPAAGGAIGIGGLIYYLFFRRNRSDVDAEAAAARAAELDRAVELKSRRVRGRFIDPKTLLRLAKSNASAPQDVDVTVFAPSKAPPRDEIIVQVIFHTPEREAEAQARASKVDPEARPLASVPLVIQLRQDDQLKVTLECIGTAIAEPVQCTIWNGRLVCVHFLMQLPDVTDERTLRPKLRIFVNGIPAGNVLFKITIVPMARRAGQLPANEQTRAFRRPFLSYASEDRVSVLKAAQLLSALKMEYFQDIMSLSPGDRWERRLYLEIENCDLFLLFWSSHARQSKWVIMEAEHALKCSSAASSQQAIEIVPILLEGPPPPMPPDSLKEIHFNDYRRHVIFAEEIVARARDTKTSVVG
jgi:hypothetical protein